MKHILTFALSLAVLCSLALPASADFGKGNSGKSSPGAGPKVKQPKVKNPQPTTPTNPTTPTTPPVILLNKNTSSMPTLNKSKLNSAPLTTQVLSKPNFSEVPPNLVGPEKFKKHNKDQTPQNPGPFPPDIYDKHNKKHDKKHDKDCHDDNNGGHGNNPPPIDPGNGSGHPLPPSQPTPPARPGYVWVPASGSVPGHWERERAPTVTPTKAGYVWVPATATVPGHWERARAK